MKKTLYMFMVIVLLSLGFLSSPALAINTLQLDIMDGTYDSGTQTIIAPTDSFKLYALLKPDFGNNLLDTYYISAALIPSIAPPGDNLGSFSFDGDTIDVTGEMTYGTPPFETIATQLYDPKDLPPHEIYDTYFKEFGFQFNSANRITAYNTQDRAINGDPIDLDYEANGEMYFAEFSVDTSLLASGYVIHFDLYNTKVCIKDKGSCEDVGDIDQTQFAPFSHDAESRKVPEPATLILLGSGLFGLGLWRLRKGKG